MKHLLRTILLLSILCMAGCKEDDQSVSFETDSLEVEANEKAAIVAIYANCRWTVSTNSKFIKLDKTEGDGGELFGFHMLINDGYDDLTHKITITSEDGTSSDVLTVVQKAKKGLEIGEYGTIPEEGGAFNVPISTNDEIVSVETPDWISFTSSRGLTGYTYTFAVQPNKTGKVRNDYIFIKGKNTDRNMKVSQDSYAPESIHFETNPSYTIKRDFSVRTFIEPEYADLSKLEISTSEGCTATVKDGYMNAKLSDYGEFDISISAEGKEICKIDGECVPPEPFQHDTQEAYVGQDYDFVRYWYYSRNYILQSSNPDVVTIGKDGTPRPVGLGTAVVSVTHPHVDCHDKITIKVEPFLLESRIGWYGQKWDYSYDVRFAARTEGPKDMACDGFVVIDKNGYAKILNDGTIKGTQFGENARIHTISTSSINVNRSGYPNVEESLRGYKVMVQMSMNGKVYQRTVPVNVMNVAFY